MDVENKFMLPVGNCDKLGDWGWHTHTAMYKIDKQ